MAAPLQRYLEHGDTLARLQDHAGRLLRAQSILVSLLPPPLGEHCAVANLKQGTLVVFAANGATAARVRQLVPTLLGGFAAAGVPLREIKLKVRIDQGAAQAAPRTPRVLTDAARVSLEALAASLPTDAPLRSSIDRLLERSRHDDPCAPFKPPGAQARKAPG